MNRDLSDVFSCLDRVMGLGTNARVEVPLSCHIVTVGVNLDHLVKVVSASPPAPCKLLVSSFHTGILAGESLSATHSEGDGISLFSKSGECIYTYYLEMFCMRSASSLPFVYLVIY